MGLDLSLVRAVLTVAERGSFRRAAQALHISQPALSQRIRGLEREVGAALFERSPGGVRLTQAGEVFVAQMAPVAERIEDALAATRRAAAGHACELRVGVTEGASGVMGSVVQRLLEASPRLEVQVLRRYPAQQLDDMAAGRLGAGMCKLPVHGIDPDLHEQLAVARTRSITSSPWPRAAGGPVLELAAAARQLSAATHAGETRL